MPLPRDGAVELFNSFSAPTLGPPPGAGWGESPQRQPAAVPSSGADVYYELPPPSRQKQRISRDYTFGGGQSRLDMDARGQSQDTFLKYDAAPITERLKFAAPQFDASSSLKDKSPQRPRHTGQELTKKAFLAHRIPTPSMYKRRAPKVGIGPGPGLPTSSRFGQSLPKLTNKAYLAHPTPDLNKTKMRSKSAVFASPGSLPKPLGFGSSSSSLRSSIVDARLELRACDEIRRSAFFG